MRHSLAISYQALRRYGEASSGFFRDAFPDDLEALDAALGSFMMDCWVASARNGQGLMIRRRSLPA